MEAGPSLTIRETALATGLSQKAIRRRIERGTLSARLSAGRLRIPMQELLERELLVSEASQRTAGRATDGPRAPSAGPGSDRTHTELVERLERQAERIGALTAELEAEREARRSLEAELAARTAALPPLQPHS